ncbi:uncharacterized protein [Drosophila takahashii]|uniref:uncharacterized protein n=1 Tax=Drosophila takahashii TaxID=29030 RepID=UPI0038991147
MDSFREKLVFKKEWESMSLDEYYEKNVKKTNFKPPRSKPHSWRSESDSHYRRTHYFASDYRQKPVNLLNLRLDILCSQIIDVKVVVASKGQVDFAQKRLVQIKKRLAQVPAKVSPPKVSPPKASLSKASPPKASLPEEEKKIESKEDSPVPIPNSPGTPETQDIDDTLVLTIGDEVLYDEAYTMDTLWMPDGGNRNES